MTAFLSNRDIYASAVCGIVPQAKERLWIATADIKDMYVEPPSQVTEARSGGRDMVPFLEVLDTLVKRGVEVRLIHAKDPGPNWRDDFDRYPTLWTAMERMLCPRGKDAEEEALRIDGFYRICMELSSDFASMAMMDAMAGNKRESSSFFAEKLFRHLKYKEWAEKHGKALRKRVAIKV